MTQIIRNFDAALRANSISLRHTKLYPDGSVEVSNGVLPMSKQEREAFPHVHVTVVPNKTKPVRVYVTVENQSKYYDLSKIHSAVMPLPKSKRR